MVLAKPLSGDEKIEAYTFRLLQLIENGIYMTPNPRTRKISADRVNVASNVHSMTVGFYAARILHLWSPSNSNSQKFFGFPT